MSEFNTYFSLHMACPLFHLPLLSMPLSHTAHLSQSQFLQAHKPTLAKMSKKQMSLESFFEKEERSNDEAAEDFKTAHKKKVAFKRKYQESFLNYGFIATGNSYSPGLLFIILSNEAMKPSKLLHHMETKHPELKEKPLEFFKGGENEQKEEKQLLKATISSNVSVWKASFLVANYIAKARKPFTIGEELIWTAAKDICCELLGEATLSKVASIPLLTSTITRQIDEIAEDIEAQLLERINESP